jgi:hypothetical protein
MPYDPQRSHRRPQVSDDGPVPVDALLDPAETTESGPEVTPRAEPVAATATAVVEPAAVFDEIEVTAATQRSRPRLVLLAAALLVALLLLAWVRRRR